MIRSICVCGSGTMGSGIAQVAAMTGFQTILYDVDKTVLQRGGDNIRKNLQSLADRNKIPAEVMRSALDRLRFADDIESCRSDMVIEAIVERLDIKLELFRHLALINSPETILASNTSSLSITSLAERIAHPGRVAGMHFFNPAPLMKLVEVVTTALYG